MTLSDRSGVLRGFRVGVAGAGLAGLTAAWMLQRRGADVFVFEARQRIGGRVLTIHDLPGAAHGELGGELIEEEGREAIGAVAAELNLRMQHVLPGGFKYYEARTPNGGSFAPGREMFDRLRRLLREEIEALKRAEDVPLSAIVTSLARHSALDWARRSRRPAQAVAAVEALRGFFVAEPSEYSLLMLVQQLSEDTDPASTKLYRMAGGNSRLPEALAAGLKRPVQIAARVVALRLRRGSRGFGRHVTASIEQRGARSSFVCDAFVIAVPATLARDIVFTPSLPPEQRQALQTLPYGRATKALVSFDRRFWRQRGRAFGTRLPVGAVWEAGSKGRGGTLALLAGGDASARLADLIDRGSQRDWQRALRWLGIGSAHVLDATAVTWEHDPYARGAYAHQSPRFDPALISWLSAPAGRLAFAGEHTSGESQGYMEGAVASGLRAADDIEIVLTDGRPSSPGAARIGSH